MKINKNKWYKNIFMNGWFLRMLVKLYNILM